VRSRKARRPATDRPVRRPHAVSAGQLRDPKATSTPSLCLAVYSGRECVGHLMLRGKLGVEAYDSNDRSLGLFPNQKAAADAISALGVPDAAEAPPFNRIS
jgi:hypothetical protein